MNNCCKWLWILNKRLYKKFVFLLILILIPLFGIFMGFMNQQESGILTIGFIVEEESEIAKKVVTELKNSSNLINFVEIENYQEGVKLLEKEKINAVWIFDTGFEEKIQNVKPMAKKQPLVSVIEPESNVLLKLSREKLSSVLFKFGAPFVYLNFIDSKLPMVNHLSEEEKLEYFEWFPEGESLFKFSTANEKTENSVGYLLSPLRGLFSILLVIAGLSVTLFLIEDNEDQLFVWLSSWKKLLVEGATIFLALVNLSVFVILTFFIVGINLNFFREILLIVFYCFSVTIFSLLIKEFFFNKNYNQTLNIDEIATNLNMSTCYFIRCFKQIVKTTPLHYLLSLRMSNAKSLLSNTNYNIAEVAESVGYDNSLYFSRLFHKHTGFSPTEYRKQFLEFKD